ncbi:MAG TPA: AMP-binding protein, partial [Mycobacterium sp.]|nr:AMP-binding protein [Mycobacterium sp.]
MVGPADFGVDRFTVPAVLDRRAELFGDRVMMSIAGEPVTFEQMRQRSCAAANVLLDLGIGRGDRVALFTATCPEWVYFWLGAGRIGAVSAAVNAANKGDFLAHTLRLSGAKVIVTDGERRGRIEEIGDRLASVTDVVVCDALAFSGGRPSADSPAGPGEVGALFFTSGTTGASKAVA